jgi:hypothetical protein
MTTIKKPATLKVPLRQVKPKANQGQTSKQKEKENEKDEEPDLSVGQAEPHPKPKESAPPKKRIANRKHLKKAMEKAILNSAETLDEDMAQISPRERIAFLKTLVEKWDPEGKSVEDVPGMKIRKVIISIIPGIKNEKGTDT